MPACDGPGCPFGTCDVFTFGPEGEPRDCGQPAERVADIYSDVNIHHWRCEEHRRERAGDM